MSTVDKKRTLTGDNGLEQLQSSPKKPKLFETSSESSNSGSQGSGQLGSPSKFFSRQVLLLNSPEKVSALMPVVY
jgi:hypothetical protein